MYNYFTLQVTFHSRETNHLVSRQAKNSCFAACAACSHFLLIDFWEGWWWSTALTQFCWRLSSPQLMRSALVTLPLLMSSSSSLFFAISFFTLLFYFCCDLFFLSISLSLPPTCYPCLLLFTFISPDGRLTLLAALQR